MLWGLRPVQLQAAHGLAVELLRRQIHLGLLKPEERLPAERALAEQLGVSRVTLREALRVLETEGYLSIRRGVQGGAFVSDRSGLRQLALHRIGRDPSRLMRILEFREAVEPAAARDAAVRRTPTDLSSISGALREIDQATDASTLRRGEAQFQLAVGEASHNPFLSKAVEETLAALFLPEPSGDFHSSKTASLESRGSLLVAIRKRNAEDARSAMQALLTRDRQILQGLPRVA